MAALTRAEVFRLYNPHHERCKKSPLSVELGNFRYPFKRRLEEMIPWLLDPWAKK